MKNMKSLIEIKNLTAAYEDKVVFTDVNIKVDELDFLVITGPNGGGKTTLVKTMLGLLKPVSGEICFFKNGQPVEELNIGYLPQYNVIDKKFPISVFDVVISGLSRQKRWFASYNEEQKAQARQIIERMGLEGLEQRPIGALSGGQIQRALLGRAIVSNPDVVVLDEPNTYIDRTFQSKLYEMLEEINRESAIVLVSHDMHAVKNLAKTLVYVNHCVEYRSLEEKINTL